MLIVSASNISISKDACRSLAIARKLRETFTIKGIGAEVLDLREYKVSFCVMCENCAGPHRCVHDDPFNDFYEIWRRHGKAVIVCPHYAGVPSKLSAVVEKIQEISYLSYCCGKPVEDKKEIAIIAHGGLTENYAETYRDNLIKPLSAMFRNLGYAVLNDDSAQPLCFGVKKYYAEKETWSACFRKDDDDGAADGIIARTVELFAK